MDDPRDSYIARVVPGKTFADVGGLWGTVNEKISIACRCQARRVAMIDITPPNSPLWAALFERLHGLGIDSQSVTCISRNVLDFLHDPYSPVFDVVHSSGILYHMPDPLAYLLSLRRITAEYLILTSAVTATKVVTREGTLELPASAAIFVPALSGSERAILKAYWQNYVEDGALGLTSDVQAWKTDDFGPWWWLPTVDALKAMCISVGFEPIDGTFTWNNNAYVLLLATR